MYYPVQLPFVFNKKFKESILYTENNQGILEFYCNFVVCEWEMHSVKFFNEAIDNIIIPDGCIDLIVDYNNKEIGFAGMSKTDFNYKIFNPCCYFGIRLKPGAFYQLTNISAGDVMDNFISLDVIDGTIDFDYLFSLSFEECKEFVRIFLKKFIKTKKPLDFVLLFDNIINDDYLVSTGELYKKFNFSSRQSQRLFLKYYGISPKGILNIIRFQKSLKILLSRNDQGYDDIIGYYDQSHYIKDIKKNIGITPLELIKRYQ